MAIDDNNKDDMRVNPQCPWKIKHTIIFLLVLSMLRAMQFTYRNDWTQFSSSSLSDLSYKTYTKSYINTLIERREPMHILFCLSGQGAGFFDEFSVAVKSVLLNAPLDRPMYIHAMADDAAYQRLDSFFHHESLLKEWRGSTPIYFETYNVEPYLEKWQHEVEQLHQDTGFQNVQSMSSLFVHHTIGTWFRLFCHQILPDSVQQVVYLDTDVVVMANLGHLRQFMDPTRYFQWGPSQCAGFLIINVPRLPYLWNATRTMDLQKYSIESRNKPSDQMVLRALTNAEPRVPYCPGVPTNATTAAADRNATDSLVCYLPDTWDLHVADGGWRLRKTLVQKRPSIGMIHFNGGASNPAAFFNSSEFATAEDVQKSFGLVQYYVRLPWVWARFHAVAQIPSGQAGYPLQLRYERRALDNITMTPNVTTQTLTTTVQRKSFENKTMTVNVTT